MGVLSGLLVNKEPVPFGLIAISILDSDPLVENVCTGIDVLGH